MIRTIAGAAHPTRLWLGLLRALAAIVVLATGGGLAIRSGFNPYTSVTPLGYSAFDDAVRVDATAHWPSFFVSIPDGRGVKFTLRRSGEYVSFPKDSYEVKLTVPFAASAPQAFVLSVGDTETEHLVDLQFQWAEGSIAHKEKRLPYKVTIEMVRKSDGKREVHDLKLMFGGGGFP